jgi:hypothetical protein
LSGEIKWKDTELQEEEQSTSRVPAKKLSMQKDGDEEYQANPQKNREQTNAKDEDHNRLKVSMHYRMLVYVRGGYWQSRRAGMNIVDGRVWT